MCLFACLRWSLMDRGPTNSGRLLLECLQKSTVHNALTEEGGHSYIYIYIYIYNCPFPILETSGWRTHGYGNCIPPQYNGHFSYCSPTSSPCTCKSSPQQKMQVLNMTTCTLSHDHLYTFKTLCNSVAIDTSVRLRWHVCCLNCVLMPLKYLNFSSMELYFGAVLWACLNVQQSKQLHMIDSRSLL